MKSTVLADEKGASLVEVLVSVAIIAIVLTIFLSALSTTSSSVAVARERVTAQNLARAQLELIKNSEYCEPELEATTEAVTIQPGPEDGKDTCIWSGPWHWNDNYGNSTELVTDSGFYGYSGQAHSLLQFDLSSIPSEAVLDSADLSLYLFDNEGTEDEVKAHRLTRDWVEGTGGENAGATWYRYDGTHSWSTPGGDYDSVEAGSFEANCENCWRTMDLTSLAQAWVNGTDNYGVILRSPPTETFNKEKHYYSSDYTDPNWRPKLDVTYTTTTTVPCYPLVVPPQGYAVTAASSVISPGLEVITVTISYNSEPVFTIGSYKVDR